MKPHLLKLSLVVSILFFLFQNNIQAAHIIGGEMTYECLGNGL